MDLNGVIVEEVGDDKSSVFVLRPMRIHMRRPAQDLRRVIDELKVVLLRLFWYQSVDISLGVLVIPNPVVLWDRDIAFLLRRWRSYWAEWEGTVVVLVVVVHCELIG